MAKSPLHELSEHGQSVWIDFLSRDMLRTGELERMMLDDAVVGVTSNPTIFQKAISAGDAYDDQLREVLQHERDPKEIFVHLASKDVGDALDLLRRVWDEGGGRDGYVSIEVDPNLAYDTEATIAEAQRLHELIDRPNLFVKIPATKEGLPAIEEMISRGRSINVTLTFSLERYAEVAEAYVRGLERLVEGGGDPGTIASVASFFVSRVDTEADKRLDEIGGHRALQGDLRGRALGAAGRAGRLAAALPLGLDLDEEPGVPGRALCRGADRPPDREHDAGGDDPGLPGSRQGRRDARAGARRGAADVRAPGGGRRRLRRRHADARARGRREVRRLVHRAARGHPGQVGRARHGLSTVASVDTAELVERIWARDATLWTGQDEARWLGWLDEPLRMQERVPELLAFAEAASGFADVVLLGMGRSSLAPEVLRRP